MIRLILAILLFFPSLTFAGAAIMGEAVQAVTEGGGGGGTALTFVDAAGNAASSGTAVSVTHGLTINSGDLVLAVVHCNDTGQSIADNNSGYSFTEMAESGASTFTRAVYWREAGGSEPSSYAWTIGSSDRWSVIVAVFRPTGGESVRAAPFDVSPSSVTGASSSTVTAPGINAGIDNATVIAMGYVDNNSRYFQSGPGDGFSEAFTTSTVNYNQPMSMYYKSVSGTPPISQGDVTWGISSSTSVGGEQFSLDPGE